MKPIDIVITIVEDDGRCHHCCASPPSRSNPFMCRHPLIGVMGYFNETWDDVTEPCMREDWSKCPLNKGGTK